MARSVPASMYRELPSVDRVIRTELVTALLRDFDRPAVTWLVREVLDGYRGSSDVGERHELLDRVAQRVSDRARGEWSVSPHPVVNGTGVILHTNLGRAPLSAEAVQAMTDAAGYSNLELNLLTGKRGSRQAHARDLIRCLVGSEDALVTVNAASAVLLAMSALARAKEVIISRGQSVEIGGGFRVPVILRQSGAKLVEVGTTNRTRLSDYESALSDRTAAILHVHASNFRMTGFTEDVQLDDLAGLARERNIVLIDDNGSGSLLDTAGFGLAHEPTPIESLQAGAHLVGFSGDKLLGGPQSGILAGSSALIQRLAKHPLARAVRPDKTILAALTATLLSYVRGNATKSLPIWRMIASTEEELNLRAQGIQARAKLRNVSLDLQPGKSTIGGGSLPEETLPTVHLVLPRSLTSQMLLDSPVPIIGITRSGRVYLDVRTILPEQEDSLVVGLSTVIAEHEIDAGQM